ncbi:MAG TPA: multicopper oxidase domain-containing protein [Candidatus Cybelea sp.]|jgi:FtsP/CotA-like multicopper oxidase with cupredoxin domain|nr:multicopper oxidase domain-containing protein [Candidatus Cybelea sp.]
MAGPNSLTPPVTGAASKVSPNYGVNELPEPPVVKAVNGVATVALIADINPATGLPSFRYNGLQGTIPTIELSPGETFKIDVQNELPASGKMYDYVNLHFHGLTVSPRGNADDVLFRLAGPGQSLHYVVHVPKNQEPGLYWYHSHVHGQTSYQVGEGGMSGAIVIDGLEKHIPALAKMKQRIIIVRSTGVGINAAPQPGMDASGDGDMAGMSGAAMANMSSASDAPDPRGLRSMYDMSGADGINPDGSNKTPCSPKSKDLLTTTLNGAYRPLITISPGEKQFFRVINATGHKTLKLNLEAEDVSLVAIDGFALDSYPGTPLFQKRRFLIIPPAARAEFIVTGLAKRDRVRTLCYDTGPNGDPDRTIFLATVVPPPHKEAGYYGPVSVAAPLVSNDYNSQLPPPAVKRIAIFSEEQKPRFFINGKSFNIHSKPMFVVHSGTMEEWTVENVTNEIHDFHIHQIHFLVESINGRKVEHPYWADSVVIPHRINNGKKSTPGKLLLLMDFRDPIIRGEFVFHCHILDHEDLGMMAKIRVI